MCDSLQKMFDSCIAFEEEPWQAFTWVWLDPSLALCWSKMQTEEYERKWVENEEKKKIEGRGVVALWKELWCILL